MKYAVIALGCDRLFESFELSLKADGLRPHTTSCYLRDVRRFWEFAQPEDPKSITSDQIRKFVTSLKSKLSPKTVHEIQMALRRFFRFLIAEGELTTDPSKPVRLTKFRVTPQPTYTLDEVKNCSARAVCPLLRACGTCGDLGAVLHRSVKERTCIDGHP